MVYKLLGYITSYLVVGVIDVETVVILEYEIIIVINVDMFDI